MRKELIDVTVYDEVGYKPLIDCNEWRVAMLNYIDELEIQNISNMQKHDKTDEIFVLLEGKCMLFTGGNGDEISDEFDAIDMEPNRVYNVKRGVWHTHTLDEKGKVLIVENRDTCDDNSPIHLLTPTEKRKLKEVFEKNENGRWL